MGRNSRRSGRSCGSGRWHNSARKVLDLEIPRSGNVSSSVSAKTGLCSFSDFAIVRYTSKVVALYAQ